MAALAVLPFMMTTPLTTCVMAGYFHYVSCAGSPVLLGVRLGQLSSEHFAAMFLQRHAPGDPINQAKVPPPPA
jgi:hypothetical protein